VLDCTADDTDLKASLKRSDANNTREWPGVKGYTEYHWTSIAGVQDRAYNSAHNCIRGANARSRGGYLLLVGSVGTCPWSFVEEEVSFFQKFFRGPPPYVPQPPIRQAWPTPSDYRNAVQNPENCFADGVLRSTVAATDRLGLPRTISGNFATVFQLTVGEVSFAVRCFASAVSNHEERYATASSYVSSLRTSAPLIDFEYVPDGIQIRGDWYPILIMEWIQGVTLDRYISSQLGNADALTKLANDWLALNRDLRQAAIGHGDLQHGNVLVSTANQLRLVDYDGMFVPPLSSEPPRERRGNRNYQHPERIATGLYSLDMDTFSVLVIYLSILAVRDQPSLWSTYNTGENLIFSERDFQNPGKTDLWNDLDKMTGESRTLSHRLREICKQPISKFWDLSDVVEGRGTYIDTRAAGSPEDRPNVLPSWMRSLPGSTLSSPSDTPEPSKAIRNVGQPTKVEGLPTWLSSRGSSPQAYSDLPEHSTPTLPPAKRVSSVPPKGTPAEQMWAFAKREWVLLISLLCVSLLVALIVAASIATR
jgi:hypothetical protein